MAVAPPALPPLADAAAGGRQLASGVIRRCRAPPGASAASVDWRECLTVSVQVAAEESGWGAAGGGGGGPSTTRPTTAADGGVHDGAAGEVRRNPTLFEGRLPTYTRFFSISSSTTATTSAAAAATTATTARRRLWRWRRRSPSSPSSPSSASCCSAREEDAANMLFGNGVISELFEFRLKIFLRERGRELLGRTVRWEGGTLATTSPAAPEEKTGARAAPCPRRGGRRRRQGSPLPSNGSAE